GVWRWVHKWMPAERGLRRLLIFAYCSQKTIYYAFLIGALAAIGADLFVRQILRPYLEHWYRPQRSDTAHGLPFSFYLGASERLILETPARLRIGGFWKPGTLVVTNARLGFLPFSWDREPWLIPVCEIAEVAAEPAPTAYLNSVRGLPDVVSLTDR